MAELILLRRSNGYGIFRLITSPSYSSLPSSAKDLTIAIITDKSISKLCIQSTEPKPSYSESDGIFIYDQAWMPVTTSNHNRVETKEDVNLILNLTDVFINEDGIWVPVEAYVYQNGEWQQLWSSRIYYEGNEYDHYTGGWTTFDRTARAGATAKPKHPIVVRNKDNIQAITLNTSDASGAGMFCTAEKIDLTPYSTIVFEGTFSSPYGNSYPLNFVAGAWSKVPDLYYNQDRLAYYEMNATSKTKITVDITDINTSAYIGFGIAYSKAILTRCYLTPKEET